MTLRKLGKTWWIDARVNGKRIRQNTGTKDRGEALKFMRSLDAASRAPSFEKAVEILRMMYDLPVEGLTPLAQLWPTYAKLAKSLGKDAIAQRSWDKRRQRVEKLLAWIEEKRPIVVTVECINGAVAADYAAHLAVTGLKSKTRANIIGDLGTVWKLLEKASPNVHNPWSNLAPKITDSERGRAFTREQEAAVLKAAKQVGKDWYAVSVLMRHTGLRYSDVARLRWDDIRDGVVYITPHKTAAHGISVALPLPPVARKALEAVPRRGDFVFLQHSELYGQRGRAAREVLNFREVLDAAGVKGPGYTIHSWRHTAATRLAESGVSTETRKRILGHTTDEMAAHYDHTQHLEEVRKALEAAAS